MNMTFAQVAYDAYCEERKWKSVKGDPLPPFDQQSIELKYAWMAVARAVIWHLNKCEFRVVSGDTGQMAPLTKVEWIESPKTPPKKDFTPPHA